MTSHDEETPGLESQHGTLRGYMAETTLGTTEKKGDLALSQAMQDHMMRTPSEMTTLLTHAAPICSMTRHNVEFWVVAVERKLADMESS
jgi:hypothetical protein